MKTFEIELRRTAFRVVTIEAETATQAEALLWDDFETYVGADLHEADWRVESIEEKAND